MSLVGYTSVLCLLAGALLAYYWLGSTTVHHKPATTCSISNPPTQAVHLVQVYPDQSKADTDAGIDTDIDIIAIHGLDTKSPHTWTYRTQNNEPEANWLQHPDMLPKIAGRARIFTCDWPAALFQSSDLVPKRIDQYALPLLEAIKKRPMVTKGAQDDDRPLFFIASCLGGILLTKALVDADVEDHVTQATCGILFLATPFEGTSYQNVAAWADPSLKIWAFLRGRQLNRLLGIVADPTYDLMDLVRRFTELCLKQKPRYHVFNFYELGRTSLLRKAFPWMPAWLCRGQPLVTELSATLQIVRDPLSLDRPHILMNKFHGPECPHYKQVAGKIDDMLGKIRDGNPLKRADAWIRNNRYTADKLKIERLSGDKLLMDQCYINLVIVQQRMKDPHHAVKGANEEIKSSPFSLHARLKAETPDKIVQVRLSAMFDSRKRGDIEMLPRRILIRGHAGVGKTTLCKKIVHDFTHTGMWRDSFDRVLWIPLRKLEGRPAGYTLEKLFCDEYLWDWLSDRPKDNEHLAHVLARAVEDGRTLFILDGLDEVSGLPGADKEMSGFLDSLLNQANVIITSRPYAKLPQAVTAIDLELETIGFYPDQVNEYIRTTFREDPPKASEIQSFLQDRQLIQGLVRIPVQLDALCFTWEEGVDSMTPLDTMTALYRAIEQELWKKDITRLGKMDYGKAVTREQMQSASVSYIEGKAKVEISLLEGLAFTGLYQGVVEFDSRYLKKAFDRFAPEHSLDKTLPCLSFLRASDSSSKMTDRNHHFLHLTYQEYFAARYFTRFWEEGLMFTSVGSGVADCAAAQFVKDHKYTARYNIFWRFVAGLLAADGKGHEFFEAIEQEPLDVLGPTHQRLVIHCLSEVQTQPESSQFPKIQERLENQLVEWLLFESQCQQECFLPREMELSPRVLCKILERSTERDRVKLVDALRARYSVPPRALEVLASWLKPHIRKDVLWSILLIMAKQRILPQEALAQVAARLSDEHWDVRRAAIEVLRDRDPLPQEILAQVAARLNDEDWDIRRAAIEVLRNRDPLPQEVLAQVAARLNNEDWHVRCVAIEVLGDRDPLPQEVLAQITARLNDEDSDVRCAAVEVLGDRDPLPQEVLAQVAARLHDEHWDVRRAAVEVLRDRDPLPQKVLAQVAARLNDEDLDVRRAVVRVLAARDPLPQEVLAQVAARLNDEDSDVRCAAVKVLGNRDPLPQEVLAQITARLNDKDSDVRCVVIKVLGYRDPLPQEVLAQVAARLNDEHWHVRCAAVKVLRDRDPLPQEVLAQVAARLNDEHWHVRCAAVKVLRDRDPLPQEILAQVAARLNDEDWDVRRAAVKVLRDRDPLPQEVLAQVAARLNDEHWHVRCAAVEVLGDRDPLPQEVLAQVAARLNDEHWHVRHAAIKVLRDRDPLPQKALAQVAARLNDKDWHVRRAAIEVLRDWDPLPQEILAQITARLNDKDSDVRCVVIKVLGYRDPLPQEVLARVAARLNDEDSDVRRAAVELLTAQSKLSTGIILPHLNILYKDLLSQSCKDHVYWFMADYGSCLYVSHPTRVEVVDRNQPFAYRIKQIREELGLPSLVSTIQ